MRDPDTSLFPSLIEGVTTGFQSSIQPSGIFALRSEMDSGPRPELSVHWENWQTAESQQSLTEELVNEEISKGWLICFDGTLEDAKRAFPLGVAVGN